MRWLIRKVAEVTYDTELVSIVGPATDTIEVVPALVAERLASAAREAEIALSRNGAGRTWARTRLEEALAEVEAYSGDST